MRKKFGLLALCLSLMLTACSMPSIGSQNGDSDTHREEDDEEEIVIELSDKKVELEAGEEFEVEIENFDDLSKLKIEVEDEDIAEADIDDEIITITGISGGKTKIIVSAKGCDDVKITVTVNEPEPEPEPEPEVVSDFPAASRYVYDFDLTEDVWTEMMDMPEEEFADVIKFFAGLNLSLEFYMEFSPSSDTEGTCVLSFDIGKFGKDLAAALSDDDTFKQFIYLLAKLDGEEVDDDFIDMYMDLKDELVESLSEDVVGDYDMDDYMYNLTYKIDYPTLYLTGEGRERECTICEDGTFTLRIDGEDFENSYFVDGLTMIFAPEK